MRTFKKRKREDKKIAKKANNSNNRRYKNTRSKAERERCENNKGFK